jgi:hypothetical protein
MRFSVLRISFFGRRASASAAKMLTGRNYCTGEGELVKRFSREAGDIAGGIVAANLRPEMETAILTL